MNFRPIQPDFPVLVLENFSVPDPSLHAALVEVVLDNKRRNTRPEAGFNFLIDRDYNDFFRRLYGQFYIACRSIFGDIRLLPTNSMSIWSYTSNKHDHAPVFFHNHIHTATINAVYYLNMPASATIDSGSITFRRDDRVLSYRPSNFDLVLFPSYLDHLINVLDDEEYRISINMEILCEPLAMPGWQP